MKKGVKIGLMITGSLGLVFGAYKLYKHSQKRKLIDTSPTGSKGSGSTPCVVFPLKNGSGMSGATCSVNQVKSLQTALNRLSYAPLLPLKVDGKFGSRTEARLDRLYLAKQVNEEMYNKLISASKTGV